MQDFNDATEFYPCRSRIPTRLFREIMEDLDVLKPQYGELKSYKTEEMRSRFLAR
jgi:hypothetical protein